MLGILWLTVLLPVTPNAGSKRDPPMSCAGNLFNSAWTLPVQALTTGPVRKSLRLLQLSGAYSVELEAVLALLSGALPALEEVELRRVVQGGGPDAGVEGGEGS